MDGPTFMTESASTPILLPSAAASTAFPPSAAETKIKPALTADGRRKHKLEKVVLKQIETKQKSSGTSGFRQFTVRGMGANVSLFSKAYKEKMGIGEKNRPKEGDKARFADPCLTKEEAELAEALSDNEEEEGETD